MSLAEIVTDGAGAVVTLALLIDLFFGRRRKPSAHKRAGRRRLKA